MAKETRLYPRTVRLLKWFAGFAVLLLAIAAAALWRLSSDSGNRMVQDMLEGEISEAAGFDIAAQGISFGLPTSAHIELLELKDEQGVWLKAKNVSARLVPSIDFSNVVLHRITADNVALLREPIIKPAQSSSEEAGGTAVSIRKLNIKALSVAPLLSGLEGNIVTNLKGSLNLSDAGILAVDIESFLKEGVPQANGSSAAVTLAYNLNTDGVDISKLLVKHPHVTITGVVKTNLSSGALEGKIQSDKTELSAWAEGMTGQAEAVVDIAGTLGEPHVTAELTTSNIEQGGMVFPDTQTKAVAVKKAEGWAGHVVVDAGKDGASAQYSFADEKLTIQKLNAKYLGAVLSGDVVLNTGTQLAQGKLTFVAKDISTLSTLVPQAQAGKVNGAVTLSHKDGVQYMDTNMRATGLLVDGQRVDSAAVKLSGAGSKWQTQLDANGRMDKPWKFVSKARINYKAADSWKVDFTKLNGAFGKAAFVNNGKAYVSQEGQSKTIHFARLAVGKGYVNIEGSQKAEQIQLTAGGNNIHIGELDLLLPQQFKNARSNVHIELSGTTAAPKLTAKGGVLGIRAHKEAAESTLNVDAVIHAGSANVNAKISDAASLESNITASIPMKFSIEPFVLAPTQGGTLKGGADLNLNIGAFAAALLPTDYELKGNVSGKLKLSGTAEKPSITGDVYIRDGSYHNRTAGASLPFIEGHLKAVGSRFDLVRFTAQDKQKNSLNATGRVQLKDAGAFAYDLTAAGKEMQLLEHAQATGRFTTDMAIKGNEKGGKVSGSIISEEIEILLPDQFAQTVPKLNVVKILPENTVVKEEPYPLLLDITFKADNKVFVRGRGVDAELQGSLAVKGSAANPDVQGKLSTIRGRYEEFGKTLHIKKCELVFDGDMPPSPYLTLVAAHKVGSTEVRPVLSGSVQTLGLKVESTPSLPDDEALSLLLFGESPSDITPLQAVQLADSLRRLSGKGGGGSLNPVGAVRDLLGVDDLKINNDGGEAADTTVGVGKYIADGVYLEVEQGADATSSKASIEVEITPSISVESSTGSTGSNNVGVNWKHDY